MDNGAATVRVQSTGDRFPLIDQFGADERPAPVVVLSAIRTAGLLEQVVARSLAPFGLHHAQFNALLLLRRHRRDGLRPSSLGELLCTTRPNVTKLLLKLQSRALIVQRPDPVDRRAVRAYATDAGLRLLEDASRNLSRDLKSAVACIPSHDGIALQDLLDRFRHALAGLLQHDADRSSL